MNRLPSHSLVSRRSIVAGIGTSSLALALGRYTTFAQEASPAAEVSRINHALNGVWEWNIDLGRNFTGAPGTFYADGAYLEYDSFNGLALGFWRATSDREAEAVVLYQPLADSWAMLSGPVEMFDLDYLPTHPDFATDIILRFRQDIRIDGTGDHITAIGWWDVFDLRDAVSEYSESLGRNARRMSAAPD